MDGKVDKIGDRTSKVEQKVVKIETLICCVPDSSKGKAAMLKNGESEPGKTDLAKKG